MVSVSRLTDQTTLLSFYKQKLPPEIFAEVSRLKEKESADTRKPDKTDVKSEVENKEKTDAKSEKEKHTLRTVAKRSLLMPSMNSLLMEVNSAIRNDFKKLQTLYSPHVKNSRDFISLGVKPLSCRDNVTVLGCGKLEHLEFLAGSFKNCSLVDIDIANAKVLKGEVKKSLQERVRTIQFDLTKGWCKKFEDLAQQLLTEVNAGKCNQEQFVKAFAAKLEEAIEATDYTYKEIHGKIQTEDYVISSLNLTQLSSHLELYFEEVYKKCFPGAPEFSKIPSIAHLSYQFRNKLQLVHIFGLRELVKDTGLVYCADTVNRFIGKIPLNRNMMPPGTTTLMTLLFDVVEQREWVWHHPHAINWSVKAFLLKPKTNSDFLADIGSKIELKNAQQKSVSGKT